MRKDCRAVYSALCLLLLASLAGCRSCRPKPAPVAPGVDAFQTSTAPGQATILDFGPNPIPAGFFCPGSPPFNGKIELRGEALQTTPPGVAGSSDTLVERLQEGSFSGGSATIPVRVRALQLTSTNPISIPCPPPKSPTWRLVVCACGNQPTTNIVAKVDQDCGCGHFDGSLKFKTCLRFINDGDGTVVGPINQVVELKITNMPWCPKPMQNALQIPGTFSVKDCDGAEVSLSGTSNFFPGPSCPDLEPGVDCWTKFASLTHCHDGPTPDHKHCINPVCGKQRG